MDNGHPLGSRTSTLFFGGGSFEARVMPCVTFGSDCGMYTMYCRECVAHLEEVSLPKRIFAGMGRNTHQLPSLSSSSATRVHDRLASRTHAEVTARSLLQSRTWATCFALVASRLLRGARLVMFSSFSMRL